MSSDISPVPHSALQQPPPPALKYSGLFRAAGVPPALIPPGDLERLYNDLNIKTREALQRYLATLQRAVNVDETQFEELKREALRVGTLTVTVQGAHGERIVASTGDVLKKEQLPDVISLIVFDSSAALRPYNVTLMNRFTLRLDFTEPPGFDTYSPWDQPTPNNSQLEVVGDDHTWVTAV